MDFASDFVYECINDEYECVSEDEFKEGMQLSDSDSDSQPEPVYSNVSSDSPRPALPVRKKKRKAKAAGKKKEHHWKLSAAPATQNAPGERSLSQNQKWFRKADTNVVSVNLSTLLSPSQMHAGDPVACPSCQALLSHISKPEGDEENKTWMCEFCHNKMHVDVEDEEIPQEEDVTYLMEAGNATKSSTLSGQDQSLVIFCVDTSGSMCVTSEVEGKVKLRGTGQLQRLESFNPEGGDQYLPSQKKRNVSYISRLQAMQAAVDDQLGTMARDFPDRRVGLVTFSNDVTVLGDGQQEEVVIAGDKLTKMDQLLKEGSDIVLPQAIRTRRTVLGEKVYKLEEGGATALGPALVVAVSMASHHPGSKVILCTDGKANIGLGKLDEDVDEQVANEFYTSVGEKAVEKGVSISVITIQGTDCKLVHLGQLADKTGGQVNIVDPLNLTKEFGNILADRIIATNVKAKFLVHKALYIINENDPNSQECHGEFQPGNVRSNTTITFEFGRRLPKKDSSETVRDNNFYTEIGPQTEDKDVAGPSNTSQETGKSKDATASSAEGAIPPTPSEYPFQLQIHYTDTEGSKALRVITKTMPATTDRAKAEKSVNLHIIGAHAAKKSADLALNGQYSKSRGVMLMNQRFAWRHSHNSESSRSSRETYRNIYSKLQGMENMLQQKQQAEIAVYGSTRSDSEDDESMEELPAETTKLELLPLPQPKSIRKSKRMHKERSSEMGDTLANMVYNFRQVNPNEVAAPDKERHDGRKSNDYTEM